MERFILVCVGQFASADGAPCYQVYELHKDDGAYYPATGLDDYGIGNNHPTRQAGAVAKLLAIREAVGS